MSLPDRILRALSPGLPADPVLWAHACLEARAGDVSASRRLTLEAWAWLPLSMGAEGRMPIRWTLDGLLPRPSAPDLWSLPPGVLAAVGDPVRPIGVLTVEIERGPHTPAQRDAHRERVLSACGAVLDEPSLELLAVLPAGALVVARKQAVRVPQGLSAVWGDTWGGACLPEPPAWRRGAKRNTRAEWVERGLAVAERGEIGAPDAVLAVSLAALDARGLLRGRLAACPPGGRLKVREWANAAAALRGTSKGGADRPPALERGSHAELAEALIARLREDGVELAYDGANLRLSSGSTWAPCDAARLSQTLQGWDGAALAQGGGLAVQANTVTGCLALLRARVTVASSFFEQAPPGVAIGGRLILPSGEDRPITPDDRVLAEHVLEGRVDGPRGVRRWLAFLGELFRDDDDREQRIAYLQEWLGAALFGEASSKRGLPFLVGAGQNGKSALCFAIQDLFTPDAVRHVDPKSLSGDHAEYYVASLEGGKILIGFDVSGEMLRDTSFLKRVISGEPIDARRPSEMPRKVVFRGAVLLAGQELPPSADTSNAFESRFLPLRLTRVFRDGEPGVLPPAVLADLLRAERVGVILWAAEGLRRLRRQGAYTCPPSALRERRLWMYGDSAAAWWGEALDFTVPADLRPWRPKTALYALYVEWAKAQRQPVLSAEKWGGIFSRKGHDRQCRGGVVGYRLALSASAAQISVDEGKARG